MNKQELYDLANKIEDINLNNSSGGNIGLYVLFSQWKGEKDWTFVQSYLTKSGFLYMFKNTVDDVVEKQEIKLVFVNGNTNECIELLNTKETDNESTS